MNTQSLKNEKMIKKIVARIENAPHYGIGNYNYFVYPYKGIEPIDMTEIKYLAEILASKIPKEVDTIVTIESDGILIATLVADILGTKLLIAKTFDYQLDDRIEFEQVTGYYNRKMFVKPDNTIKNVAIVDCVISTGGSAKGLISALDEKNINVLGFYTIIDKCNYRGSSLLSNKIFSIFSVITGKESTKVVKINK